MGYSVDWKLELKINAYELRDFENWLDTLNKNIYPTEEFKSYFINHEDFRASYGTVEPVRNFGNMEELFKEIKEYCKNNNIDMTYAIIGEELTDIVVCSEGSLISTINRTIGEAVDLKELK